MPENSKPVNSKPKNSTGPSVEAEAEKISVKLNNKVEIEEQWKYSRATEVENMMTAIIEGYTHSTAIESEIESSEWDVNFQEKMYVYFAYEIINALEERIRKKRIQSQRAISSSILSQAKSASNEKGKSKKKKQVKKDEEEKGIDAKRVSTQELGKEMDEDAEMMQSLEESRKQEMEEAENTHKKHAAAYKQAFYLFGRIISIRSKGDTEVRDLIENVYKMGEEDLMTRQLAVEKVGHHPKKELAVNPLLAGLKDKNLCNYSLMALDKIPNFKLVGILIDLVLANSSKREALTRGMASQAVGSILGALNKKKKKSGIIQLFSVIKQPAFEQKLEKIIPLIKKDILDDEMRNDYYTPQCIGWMVLFSDKLVEIKKKDLKIGFIKKSLATPLSKSLKEFNESIKKYAKSK